MYSLIETAKTSLDLTRIKQSTSNSELRSAIDDFFTALAINVNVITDGVDPLDDIVPTIDPNPEIDIVATIDPNPPITFNAVRAELTAIAEAQDLEATTVAAEDLLDKLDKVLEALRALIP